MTRPIRPAFYIRVSKQTQKFDSQESELKAYGRRMGWAPPVFYREKKSGARAPRTVLNELMADARAGKFDVVAVWKLDRLGRSLSHLLQILNELSALNVPVIATSQGIDTGPKNPLSRILCVFIGAMAEFERELNQERTAAGVDTARRRGIRIGRPPVPEDVKKSVLELRFPKDGRGWGMEGIARELKISLGAVHRIIAEARQNGFQKAPPPKRPVILEGSGRFQKPIVL